VTRLFFALTLVMVAIAQATILPALNVFGIGPNLCLVLLLVWSGLRGVSEGIVWAFPLGLLFDILSLAPLGSHGLVLLPVAVIGGLAQRRLFHSGIIVMMLLVISATFARQIVASLLPIASGLGFGFAASTRPGLLTALLNMVVVPPIYLVVLVMNRMGVGRAATA
jgi:rod shape-determining protein MreD